MTALAAIAYFRSTDTLREAAFKQLRVIADDRENKINQFVEDQQGNIVRIARTPAIRDATDQLLSRETGAPEHGTSYDTLDRMLRSSIASSPGLNTIFFMTDTGEIVFSTDKSIEGQSRSASKFFTQGWNGPIVQNVYPSPVTSKPTITVAAPLFGVFSSEGKRLGVAAAHVRLSKLDDIVDSRTGLGETGEAYLINPSNLFISTDGFGTPEFPGGVHSAGIDAAVKKGKGLGIYRNYTNTTVVGVYRWMPKLDLALMVEMHIGEALAPAR